MKVWRQLSVTRTGFSWLRSMMPSGTTLHTGPVRAEAGEAFIRHHRSAISAGALGSRPCEARQPQRGRRPGGLFPASDVGYQRDPGENRPDRSAAASEKIIRRKINMLRSREGSPAVPFPPPTPPSNSFFARSSGRIFSLVSRAKAERLPTSHVPILPESVLSEPIFSEPVHFHWFSEQPQASDSISSSEGAPSATFVGALA
jgi:hypothetical protein